MQLLLSRCTYTDKTSHSAVYKQSEDVHVKEDYPGLSYFKGDHSRETISSVGHEFKGDN